MDYTTANGVLDSFDEVLRAKDAEAACRYAEARQLYELAVEKLLLLLPSLTESRAEAVQHQIQTCLDRAEALGGMCRAAAAEAVAGDVPLQHQHHARQPSRDLLGFDNPPPYGSLTQPQLCPPQRPPPRWAATYDASSGYYYFTHLASGQAQWNQPPDYDGPPVQQPQQQQRQPTTTTQHAHQAHGVNTDASHTREGVAASSNPFDAMFEEQAIGADQDDFPFPAFDGSVAAPGDPTREFQSVDNLEAQAAHDIWMANRTGAGTVLPSSSELWVTGQNSSRPHTPPRGAIGAHAALPAVAEGGAVVDGPPALPPRPASIEMARSPRSLNSLGRKASFHFDAAAANAASAPRPGSAAPRITSQSNGQLSSSRPQTAPAHGGVHASSSPPCGTYASLPNAEVRRRRALEEDLNPAQRKAHMRRLTAEEVLSTERTYCAQLHLLCKIYVPYLESAASDAAVVSPRRASNVASPMSTSSNSLGSAIAAIGDLGTEEVAVVQRSVAKIVGALKPAAVTQLFELSKRFLADLEVTLDEGGERGVNMGNVFMKMYCAFSQQHYVISKMLSRLLQQHPCLAVFMNRLRSDALRGKPASVLYHIGNEPPTLESALIQPIQRIPRYKLFLEQLLKYTDEVDEEHGRLSTALKTLKDVGSQINRTLEEKANTDKVLEIQSLFKPPPPEPLVAPHRRLLREGSLQKLSGRRGLKRYEFFLFTDVVVYADKMPFGALRWHNTVHFSEARILQSLVAGRKFGFEVLGDEKCFICVADTDEERKLWVDDINSGAKKKVAKRQSFRFLGRIPASLSGGGTEDGGSGGAPISESQGGDLARGPSAHFSPSGDAGAIGISSRTASLSLTPNSNTSRPFETPPRSRSLNEQPQISFIGATPE